MDKVTVHILEEGNPMVCPRDGTHDFEPPLYSCKKCGRLKSNLEKKLKLYNLAKLSDGS